MEGILDCKSSLTEQVSWSLFPNLAAEQCGVPDLTSWNPNWQQCLKVYTSKFSSESFAFCVALV